MEPEALVHASPQPQPNPDLGSRQGENAKISRTSLKIGSWRVNKCAENCVKVGKNTDSQLLLS